MVSPAAILLNNVSEANKNNSTLSIINCFQFIKEPCYGQSHHIEEVSVDMGYKFRAASLYSVAASLIVGLVGVGVGFDLGSREVFESNVGHLREGTDPAAADNAAAGYDLMCFAR